MSIIGGHDCEVYYSPSMRRRSLKGQRRHDSVQEQECDSRCEVSDQCSICQIFDSYAYFMNATIGRMRALLVYDRS